MSVSSDNSSLIYGLEFQARALVSQSCETEKVRFLVGTQSLKISNNQVHLVTLNEDTNSLSAQVYRHKEGEIWSLSASPTDRNIFSSCYNVVRCAEGDCCMKASLWKVPEDNELDLQLVQHLDTSNYGIDIKVAPFHPTNASQLAIVIDNKVLVCDTTENKILYVIVLEGKGQPYFTTGKWSPLIGTQFATANDCSVKGWDVRSGKHAWNIESSHSQLVRDLDFNPNRHHFLGTCGDDGKARFWDLRDTSQPVVSRSDHSHWVWCLRYNHYHDELVATCSSDTRLLITRIQSISSSSVSEDNEGNKEKKLSDGVIATFDQHEDSVYCVEWSSADPWVLASLSYDGRLLINRVPKAEKYKILL